MMLKLAERTQQEVSLKRTHACMYTHTHTHTHTEPWGIRESIQVDSSSSSSASIMVHPTHGSKVVRAALPQRNLMQAS